MDLTARTFELCDYGTGYIEAWTVAQSDADTPRLLARADRLASTGPWDVQVPAGPGRWRPAGTAGTKADAKQRLRDAATNALTSGGEP